jgi:F0F1-type ATP synthase assembly protein I
MVLGPEHRANSGGGDRAQLLRAMALASGIGCWFATCLGLAVGLGVLLTRQLGNPVPLVIGVIAGFVAGGYGVYRMVMGVYR